MKRSEIRRRQKRVGRLLAVLDTTRGASDGNKSRRRLMVEMTRNVAALDAAGASLLKDSTLRALLRSDLI